MKRFLITLFLALVLTCTSVFSIDTHVYESYDVFNVGKSPLKIIKLPGSESIHIFCAGEDLNYDDEYQEGEELPSWWIMDNPNVAPRKVLDFDKFLKYRPFRPALDNATNTLYVPMIGKIIALDLEGEAVEDDLVAEIDAQSISFAGGHLLITVSPGMNEKGRLDVLNVSTGQILQTVEGGINILDCIYYPGPGGISIALLNQGEFGTDNSTVMYGSINHMFDFQLDEEVVVGDAANHILHHNGKLYVAVNMSHWIKVIDVVSGEIETWHTGTTGWDGPRESVVRGDRLFVTTYSGDVREFDLETGVLINLYESGYGDKIENMSFYNDDIFFSANPYDFMYSPSNMLYMWGKEENELSEMLKKIEVGTAPIGLLNDTDYLHVFCMGDEDINEAPSWWTISMAGNEFVSEKRYEFNHGDLKFPFKPAFSAQTRTLFIAGNGVIKSYNVDDFTLDDDMVAEFDAVALDMAGTHLMAAVQYPDRADSIVVINLQTSTVLQKVSAGNMVTDVKYYPMFVEGSQQPVISLAILTHEDEGDEDYSAKLLYGPISHMADFSLENEVPVGKGGFSLALPFVNKIAVASYISGEVYFVDAQNHEVSSIALGAQIPYGPMAFAALRGIGVLTGTNWGDLRPVTYEEMEEFDITIVRLQQFLPIGIPISSVVASVNPDQGKLFVAATGPADYDFDSPNSFVYILTDDETSVREFSKGDIAGIKIYPNPAIDYFTIEAQLRESIHPTVTFEIISMNGNKVASVVVPSGMNISHTFDARSLGLASGTYILNIVSGKEIKAMPFNIVR